MQKHAKGNTQSNPVADHEHNIAIMVRGVHVRECSGNSRGYLSQAFALRGRIVDVFQAAADEVMTIHQLSKGHVFPLSNGHLFQAVQYVQFEVLTTTGVAGGGLAAL